MSDAASTPPDGESAEAERIYREAARTLADGLDATVEAWIVRIVVERLPADWPAAQRAEFRPRVEAVAAEIHAAVVPRLTALVQTDVDRQSAGPLGVLRAAVGPANALLAEAQVPPPKRDPVTESMFPDDPYHLGPANFDDVNPVLHEAGLVWGAAKAHLVLSRHRH